jgi:hypothetical protein
MSSDALNLLAQSDRGKFDYFMACISNLYRDSALEFRSGEKPTRQALPRAFRWQEKNAHSAGSARRGTEYASAKALRFLWLRFVHRPIVAALELHVSNRIVR